MYNYFNISFIYGKAAGHLVRLSGVLHVLNTCFQLMAQYKDDIHIKINSVRRNFISKLCSIYWRR